MRATRPQRRRRIPRRAAGATLTKEQKDAQAARIGRLHEAAVGRGSCRGDRRVSRQLLDRATSTSRVSRRRSSVHPHHYFVFDIGGMMILGIGLPQVGVFGDAVGAFSIKAMAAAGFGAGIPLAALATRNDTASGFDPGQRPSAACRLLARIPIALAHVAVVMLVFKAGILRWLTAPLAAVGQTAFSCYMAESLICTTIFYGYGFGLFGQLQRYQLQYVVAAIWIVLLIVAPIWLRHFRFGPLEWLWRSLTYGSAQPMRAREGIPA